MTSLTRKSVPGALIRFCSDCCQESTETSWSDRFGTRLCLDCFNSRCEQIENEYDENSRIVLCEACESEGRLYFGDPETGWSEPCPHCEGTGGELIKAEPIEAEDFAEAFGS